MFKALTIFRIAEGWAPALEAMESALMADQFAPIGATQDKSVGWVPPRGNEHDAMVEAIDGQRIMKLRIETKSVPGATVREKAQAEADNIEATTGRKPGKKQMKELREDALLALLPQAFSKQTSVLVWIDPAAGLLMTDASSQGKLDEVVTALVRSFNDLSLALLQTDMTPLGAMTAWLLDADDCPEGFAIERACELRSGDEEKSVVKFNRHNLVTDEVRKHITEGKLPKWTAMSWEGRVAFVLDDCMRLKKIAFLEGVFDDRADDSESGFDADVALATGELRKLIPALIDALGGELVPGAEQLPAAPGSVAAHADGVPVDPYHSGSNDPDPLIEQARAIVITSQKGSISYIQRKLAIGYNRAARLLEDLEKLGVVSHMHSSGQRDVLAKS